mgnify:CR=1 FL=1|jgi:hypothetical protein
MNLNESLSEWVAERAPDFAAISTLTVMTMGQDDDITLPFLGIYETGSSIHETEGVTLYGVTDFTISIDLQTVPASTDQGGTLQATEQQMRRDLYDILGDRDAIEWLDGRNGWRVFDIRQSSPTTEADEERRISKWILTAVACPI